MHCKRLQPPTRIIPSIIELWAHCMHPFSFRVSTSLLLPYFTSLLVFVMLIWCRKSAIADILQGVCFSNIVKRFLETYRILLEVSPCSHSWDHDFLSIPQPPVTHPSHRQERASMKEHRPWSNWTSAAQGRMRTEVYGKAKCSHTTTIYYAMDVVQKIFSLRKTGMTFSSSSGVGALFKATINRSSIPLNAHTWSRYGALR